MGDVLGVMSFALSASAFTPDSGEDSNRWDTALREENLQRLADQRTRNEYLDAVDEQEARSERERSHNPPDWLGSTRGFINVAVAGNSGSGKSSIINALRRIRPRDPGAAKVGVGETTMEPHCYEFPDFPQARLWDLPGAGTAAFPRDKYIETVGLRYFDVVIAITSQRFTETEISISKALQRMRIPYFMVRTKIDIDVSNNENDHDMTAEETLQVIRTEMSSMGIERPYLVSSRHWDRYDLTALLRDGFLATLVNRGMSLSELDVTTRQANTDGAQGALGPGLQRVVEGDAGLPSPELQRIEASAAKEATARGV